MAVSVTFMDQYVLLEVMKYRYACGILYLDVA